MGKCRTDLAMETAGRAGAPGEDVSVERAVRGGMEMTWVRVRSREAAHRLGKPEGAYWTLTHAALAKLSPEERMVVAGEITRVLQMLLPKEGDVLVLGLGNRRLTADALGARTVEGILVTRHLQEPRLRGVCALSPGVLGVTGVETAELAIGLAEHVKPAAVVVIDALAAMETGHICTTVQVTDTGISPGSGVGNHRKGITADTLGVPVVAVGVPMVVYASTMVRDALRHILSCESSEEAASAMAEELSIDLPGDLVVTPRDIDETVQGLADMLALAINCALQPRFTPEEMSHYLH